MDFPLISDRIAVNAAKALDNLVPKKSKDAYDKENKRETEIRFHVSGNEHTVRANDVSPDTTLNAYLRDHLHLTATKKMCLEGGCGSCIVAVEETDADGNTKIFAVNSCLVSIFSCHGWKILTNEGIGDPKSGYNEIQTLLAENNGTQCGFCSSGMVMNMYALHQSGPKTKEQIETSFGGNICRCTGYRPILTAFKKLASDADDQIKIEDLEDLKLCDTLRCYNGCPKPCKKTPLYYELGESRWMKVYTLKDLLQILSTTDKKYMLVAGNTGKGVYWTTDDFSADVYIDVTAVLELTSYSVSEESLIFGGNLNLTDAMKICRIVAKTNPNFTYLIKMADHGDLISNVPVRNIGTLAGNLMLKHMHNDFLSDIFVILETVKATLVIVDTAEVETRVTPQEFLKIDMHKKVIKQIILPPYDSTYRFASYKIMPRAQNTHALITAGFLLQLNGKGIVKSARVVYSGINPNFVHATKTETLLVGIDLFNNASLQALLKSLDDELNPDWVLPDASPAYRKQLAMNLFYKYVLSIAPPSSVSERNKSGGTLLFRPVSTGTQEINSDKSLYPLTEPITKLEALAQSSGTAQYIIDIPDQPGQLHAILVPASAIPGSVITSIDATEALAIPGVVAFYSAKDIPGVNSIAVPGLGLLTPEEVFCSGTVKYYSQPVGVIVAKTEHIAWDGQSAVKVKTTPPTTKPLLTIQEVLKQGKTDRITHQTSFVPKSKGTNVQKVIKGQTYLGEQYHLHMETHTCVATPTEDGLDVHAGTQWIDHAQGVISQVLGLPSQKINISVRRLGGGFGAKLVRPGFVSAATSLAAYKLNKPVRMWMSLSDNMDMVGKRHPSLVDYEVGVDNSGAVQYLTAKLYSDFGVGGNEPVDSFLVDQFQNCYLVDTWTFDTYAVRTDNYSNCYTRAPGTLEGLAAIESIMDHIAHELKIDPLEVKKANMDSKKYPILVQFLDDLEQKDNIAQRKLDIKTYNEANRWKKKGLSIVPMSWTLEVAGSYTTVVSIYHLDGGVAIYHGGVEMGQGINTKVAQVCAYKFGIPLSKISVKPTLNGVTPNNYPTGGSLTSEAIVFSLLRACDVLLERIKPIREKNPNASWEELMSLCFVANVNLSSNGQYTGDSPGIQEYPIFGVCALELEVDILTGKHEIIQVDILEDVGRSMSPLIDLGQLEGGFIMGLGYFSSEEIVKDSNGKLLTNRTWNYKPFGPRDIPAKFNIRFSNNTPNPVGVLKAKAIAEPATCLSVAFPLALRVAVGSARAEASSSASTWYPLNGTSSVENTLLNTLNDYTQYSL